MLPRGSRRVSKDSLDSQKSELTASEPVDGVRGVGEVVREDCVGSLVGERSQQGSEAIDKVLCRVFAQALVVAGAAWCGKRD